MTPRVQVLIYYISGSTHTDPSFVCQPWQFVSTWPHILHIHLSHLSCQLRALLCLSSLSHKTAGRTHFKGKDCFLTSCCATCYLRHCCLLFYALLLSFACCSLSLYVGPLPLFGSSGVAVLYRN